MSTKPNIPDVIIDDDWAELTAPFKSSTNVPNSVTNPEPTPTSPDESQTPRSFTADSGEIMVWDADIGKYTVAGHVDDGDSVETIERRVTNIPQRPRQRQPSVPFTPDMVTTIRLLRQNSFSIPEIAHYVRRQPGYERATDDMVRQRLLRGATDKPPMRLITDDMVRRLKDNQP